MEEMQVAKEKIDLLLELFEVDLLNLDNLLDNETEESNLTIVNENNRDFDFLKARTLIKEAKIGLNIL